jgi:hypothetical protein
MTDFLEYRKAGNLAVAEAQKNGTRENNKLDQIYANAYAAAYAAAHELNLKLAVGGTGTRKRKILKTKKTRRKCNPLLR